MKILHWLNISSRLNALSLKTKQGPAADPRSQSAEDEGESNSWRGNVVQLLFKSLTLKIILLSADLFFGERKFYWRIKTGINRLNQRQTDQKVFER